MTQAAVSQQIRGLEAQLGVELFKRLPRGLELTEAGKSYIPVVHASIQKLAAATEEMFGGNQTKVLTIRSNLVFFITWLTPRLHKFFKRHPEIKVRFSSNIWVQYSDTVFDSGADIEIRHGQGNWEGLISDRLTSDELVPVCSPTLVNELPPPSSPEQLKDYTLLHVVGYEEGWGYWLKKTGYPKINAASGVQFDTLISALEMAKAGQGIALGRSTLVNDMIRDGLLINPFNKSLPVSEAFYLCMPAEGFRHSYIDKFRDWILEEAKAE